MQNFDWNDTIKSAFVNVSDKQWCVPKTKTENMNSASARQAMTGWPEWNLQKRKNPSFANVFVSDKHWPQRRFALSNTMKPLGALWVWTKRYQDKWATTNTLKLYLSVLLTLGKWPFLILNGKSKNGCNIKNLTMQTMHKIKTLLKTKMQLQRTQTKIWHKHESYPNEKDFNLKMKLKIKS